MNLIALSNIKHSGQDIATGEVFALDDKEDAKAIDLLIESGVARESTREDELVAEAKAKAAAEEEAGESADEEDSEDEAPKKDNKTAKKTKKAKE